VYANEAIGVPRAGIGEDLLASPPAARSRRAHARWRLHQFLGQFLGQFPDRFPGQFLGRFVGRFLGRFLGELAMPPASRLQWAAAVALILAQSAVITGLLVFGGGATYRVAAGPSPGDHLSALVAFADEAKAAAMTRLLTEFDATIVDGPKPGGVYKIRMRSRDNSRAAQQELLDRLAARRDVIRIVLPSGN
jgi:hypothetical protein